MTLVGFLRANEFNIYTSPERIIADDAADRVCR